MTPNKDAPNTGPNAPRPQMPILGERRRNEPERLRVETIQSDHKRAQADGADLERRKRAIVDEAPHIDDVCQSFFLLLVLSLLLSRGHPRRERRQRREICCRFSFIRLARKVSSYQSS